MAAVVAAVAERLEFNAVTGHEPIDSMGLIHMNGRVYDPHLGRFTQADPFIQFPGSSQSYNRYSYVLNNPLTYTDPSGYSAWTKFRDKILKPVVAIVASYFTYNISSAWAVNAGLATEGGTMAGAIGGAAGGFVGGAINSGNLRGAASGAFGGMLFGAIGGHYGSLKGRDFWGWDGIASQGVAHGLAGGVMAELGGGKFGHGFAAAGVGFAGGAAGELGGLALEEQFVVATVAGGTASSLTGGKFANGALTSAFGFVFNQVQHRAAQKKRQTKINYKARAISGAAPMGAGYIDVEFEILNVDGTARVNFSGRVLTTNMGVGLDLSFVESEGVLTGPYIPWAKSAVINALDGQLVTGDGFTFSIGNGIVVGGDFDIGPYTDSDGVFQVKGISVGWEGFRGSLKLDQDSFSVTSANK